MTTTEKASRQKRPGALVHERARLPSAAANDTGRHEIYVRAFPGPEGKWQVSIDGGNEPKWSPDGKRLYFRSEQGVYQVDVDTSGAFRAGMPQRLLDEGPPRRSITCTT